MAIITQSNFEQCVKQIEIDFDIDLMDNISKNNVMLRGESMWYEKTEPSMKRFITEEDGKTMKSFQFVSPIIDFQDIFSSYHSEKNNISYDVAEGFLQHYGFPTDIFDISPSLETAKIFSHLGNYKDEVGAICVTRTQGISSYYKLINISTHPFARRPQLQTAYGAKHEKGISDLKDEKLKKYFQIQWYRFRKSQEDIEWAKQQENKIYPDEKELGVFFSSDLEDFVRNHFTYRMMTEDQKNLLNKMLDKIRNQNTK
jgi:hypothetical protein